MTPVVSSAEHRPVGGVRFVSDFRYLARAFCDIAPVVLDPSRAWLPGSAGSESPGCGPSGSEPPPAASSPDEWQEARCVIRVGIEPERGRPQVQVFLGQPRERGSEIVIPLVWVPGQLGFLVPTMEGDLVIGEVDARTCRLGLAGSYRPPLASADPYVDRLWLHRVAESSVRNFLEDVELALLGATAPRPWASVPLAEQA